MFDGDSNYTLQDFSYDVVIGLPYSTLDTLTKNVSISDLIPIPSGANPGEFGLIVSEQWETEESDWTEITNDLSLTASSTPNEKFEVYQKIIDDDSNVVIDTFYVNIVQGVPIITSQYKAHNQVGEPNSVLCTNDPVYGSIEIQNAKLSTYYEKFGALYSLTAFINYSTKDFTDTTHFQGVCPANWRLPNIEDWYVLRDYIAKTYNYTEADKSQDNNHRYSEHLFSTGSS